MSWTESQKFRRAALSIIDLGLLALAWVGTYLLRFPDFSIPTFPEDDYRTQMVLLLPWVIGLHLAFQWIFGLYRGMLRYVGTSELRAIGLSALSTTSAMFLFNLWVQGQPSFLQLPLNWNATAVLRIPYGILGIYFFASIVLVGGFRFSSRLWAEGRRRFEEDAPRTLIVGAGDLANGALRELLASPTPAFRPVCAVTTMPQRVGSRIQDIPVVGVIGAIDQVVREYSVNAVLIALDDDDPAVLREVVGHCQKAKIAFHLLPSLTDIAGGRVEMRPMRRVRIEDLLGREPVDLNLPEERNYLRGETVLITGAGGSIGSELARQVLRAGPAAIVLLGKGENSIFEIAGELARQGSGVRIEAFIGDVRDSARMAQVFERYRPTIIFHAAAHKHVPLMENAPGEAFKNNALGTATVAWLAHATGARRFVLVSTDKAVRPTSIMGATKRLAEMTVFGLARESETVFQAVRFGNVMGSRGSVIPIFERQIAEGGPVTVTHPEVTRFFMTIPEAVSLTLQAASRDRSGSLYVLDMGKPVRIADLARNLVTLAGLQPDVDIEIRYTGLRPGEKLTEELLTESEGTQSTEIGKVWTAKPDEPMSWDDLKLMLEELQELADSGRDRTLVERLRDIVPDFHPESIPERDDAEVIARYAARALAAVDGATQRVRHEFGLDAAESGGHVDRSESQTPRPLAEQAETGDDGSQPMSETTGDPKDRHKPEPPPTADPIEDLPEPETLRFNDPVITPPPFPRPELEDDQPSLSDRLAEQPVAHPAEFQLTPLPLGVQTLADLQGSSEVSEDEFKSVEIELPNFNELETGDEEAPRPKPRLVEPDPVKVDPFGGIEETTVAGDAPPSSEDVDTERPIVAAGASATPDMFESAGEEEEPSDSPDSPNLSSMTDGEDSREILETRELYLSPELIAQMGNTPPPTAPPFEDFADGRETLTEIPRPAPITDRSLIPPTSGEFFETAEQSILQFEDELRQHRILGELREKAPTEGDSAGADAAVESASHAKSDPAIIYDEATTVSAFDESDGIEPSPVHVVLFAECDAADAAGRAAFYAHLDQCLSAPNDFAIVAGVPAGEAIPDGLASRVRVLPDDPGPGPARWNQVIGEVPGDTLMVALSPEVRLLPEFFQKLRLALARDEDAAVLYCDHIVREGDRETPVRTMDHAGCPHERFEFGPVVAYQAATVMLVGGLDESLQHAWLYDLHLRLMQEGLFIRIPHTMYVVEVQPAAASGSSALYSPGKGPLGGFSYVFYPEDVEREVTSVFERALREVGAWIEIEPGLVPQPKSQPDVMASIVIPVLNREKYIGHAIESVRRGTFADFEVIVVDNGSTDGTREVVEALAQQDSRVRLLLGEGDSIAAALNQGIRAANGKYICQLDSDDEYATTTLEKMIGHLESHPHCGLAISYYRLMDEQGQIIEDVAPITHSGFTRNQILRRDGAGAVRIFPRSVLVELGYYDEKHCANFGEDYDMVLKVSERYDVDRVHEVLYHYRRHSDNTDVTRDPAMKYGNKNRARQAALRRRMMMNGSGRR